MAKPTNTTEWGNAGTDPGAAKKAAGWIKEKPPFAWFNWLFYTIEQWLAWVKADALDATGDSMRGTLDFDPDVFAGLNVPGLVASANEQAIEHIIFDLGERLVNGDMRGDTSAKDATVTLSANVAPGGGGTLDDGVISDRPSTFPYWVEGANPWPIDVLLDFSGIPIGFDNTSFFRPAVLFRNIQSFTDIVTDIEVYIETDVQDNPGGNPTFPGNSNAYQPLGPDVNLIRVGVDATPTGGWNEDFNILSRINARSIDSSATNSEIRRVLFRINGSGALPTPGTGQRFRLNRTYLFHPQSKSIANLSPSWRDAGTGFVRGTLRPGDKIAAEETTGGGEQDVVNVVNESDRFNRNDGNHITPANVERTVLGDRNRQTKIESDGEAPVVQSENAVGMLVQRLMTLTAHQYQNLDPVAATGLHWWRVAKINGTLGRGGGLLKIATTGGPSNAKEMLFDLVSDQGANMSVNLLSAPEISSSIQAIRLTKSGSPTETWVDVQIEHGASIDIPIELSALSDYVTGEIAIVAAPTIDPSALANVAALYDLDNLLKGTATTADSDTGAGTHTAAIKEYSGISYRRSVNLLKSNTTTLGTTKAIGTTDTILFTDPGEAFVAPKTGIYWIAANGYVSDQTASATDVEVEIQFKINAALDGGNTGIIVGRADNDSGSTQVAKIPWAKTVMLDLTAGDVVNVSAKRLSGSGSMNSNDPTISAMQVA